MLARTPAVDLAALGLARIVLRERDDVWQLVDADDYEWLQLRRWNVGWHNKTPWKLYGKRNVGTARLTVYMHREILIRATPGADEEFLAAHVVDHINGQSLDARKANLCWKTPRANSQNRLPRGTAPSLDDIVARLAREAGATLASRAMAAMPF